MIIYYHILKGFVMKLFAKNKCIGIAYDKIRFIGISTDGIETHNLIYLWPWRWKNGYKIWSIFFDGAPFRSVKEYRDFENEYNESCRREMDLEEE